MDIFHPEIIPCIPSHRIGIVIASIIRYKQDNNYNKTIEIYSDDFQIEINRKNLKKTGTTAITALAIVQINTFLKNDIFYPYFVIWVNEYISKTPKATLISSIYAFQDAFCLCENDIKIETLKKRYNRYNLSMTLKDKKEYERRAKSISCL